MKIKHVYGNVLRIDIPLTIKIRTIEEGASSEREEPFYPDATKGCIVELANNYNRKIEYNATIKDNIVHIEDIGKISIGQYKVTVKCYDAEGNPYRYMVRDIVEICDATADAGIEAGVEFNAETYTLEGAVFVSYGVEQVQADWEEEDETSKAFIKNKPDVYTKTETDAHITQQVQAERERAEYAEQALGQAIGTKQDTINDLQEIRQGAQLGATAIQEEQDPTVPQWAKAANKPSYNANEVGALPSTTKYGSSIDMVLNSTTYVLTLTLKDQDGNSINSQSVDLPLESVVVNGRYDAASKKIILTLQSGSTLDIPVGDLVAGLQSEITSTNMLDADLVDDTNSAHKFVSAQEKEAWNNKSDFSGSYNDLTDKPAIPVVPTNVSAFNNDAGYLTQHQDISGKVDKVEGKGLSTNDYTDEEKEKLAGLENYDDTQVRQLINEEKIARQQGDNALIESITQEETRARGVEQNLDSKIGVNTAAITAEKTRAESVEQTLQLAIDTINGKIPAQATSQNQLADKDFVNSSVSTATADFKGTYNSLEDLQQVTANANDYAFVIANDAAGNTVYKRYKWVESTGWTWEYDLNNSSFTQAQWAAIQSGITAALVTKLSDLPDNSTLNQRITQAIANALLNYYTKSEIDAALENKQNTLTFDTTPQSGSTNPVTSGGVKNALDTKEETANKVTSISQSSTDAQYPSANAVVNAIGKRGVISQTQTWASDWSSYTMSNIVIGIIPQSAIDLYEEAGATFNENGYQTGIGYFEMNGITDLSYQNIKDAYNFSYHNNGQWTCTDGTLPRTNFPLCNGINFNGCVSNFNRAISLHLYYLNGKMEVLRLSRKLTEGYGASLSQYSSYLFFYSSRTLKEVLGVMDIYNARVLSHFFADTPNLKTVRFYELRTDITLSSCSVLSLDSVVYMVQNSANTSAITITLHPDVYAVSQADTTEYTYKGNTYTGIIALATARNITIATA